MINEYKAFLQAFQKGKEIASAAKAKKYQSMGSAVAAFLSAVFVIAQGFGYHIPVDQETLTAVGSGIGAIALTINAVLTVVTSSKIGLKK